VTRSIAATTASNVAGLSVAGITTLSVVTCSKCRTEDHAAPRRSATPLGRAGGRLSGTLRPLRNWCRLEQLFDLTDQLCAWPLRHGLRTPEIESSELDPADPTQCPEPEVGEEVAGEDRPVHQKALSADSPWG
jgi:hypothetical protein